MRQEFTKSTKLGAWKRCGGHCEICTAKLFPGHFDYHHDRECAFDGSNNLSNCVVACDNCHGKITKERAPIIAKSNRVRAGHLGIKKRTSAFSCGRTSPWKKKISGEVVRR